MSEGLDERPEVGSELEVVGTAEVVEAKQIPVASFEGEYVRKMLCKIPAIVIEMEAGYPRGTHLKLEIELRVKGVGMDENRSGEIERTHSMVYEDVKLVGAYTAAEASVGIGGGLGGPATDE